MRFEYRNEDSGYPRIPDRFIYWIDEDTGGGDEDVAFIVHNIDDSTVQAVVDFLNGRVST